MNPYGIDALMVCFDSTGRVIYNIDQAYAVAHLRKKEMRAEVYVSESRLIMDRLVDEILSQRPRCIIFYCDDQNYRLVHEASSRITQTECGVPSVIVTGPAARYSFDILPEILPHMDVCLAKDSIEEIHGLVHYLKTGLRTTIETPSATLDAYPSPYLSGVIDPVHCQKINRMIVLTLSKGCAMQCSFCKFAAMNGKSIRLHSIEYILTDIKFLLTTQKNSGVELDIKFMDEFFTLNKARVLEFCRRIREEGLHFKFSIHARADHMDDELLAALKSAGCARISYGLESGVPRILEEMRKTASGVDYISKFHQTVEKTKQHGITAAVNAIYGWRTETREEADETLRLVESLEPDRYEHCILTYYPGTEAYDAVSDRVNRKSLSLKYHTFPALFQYNPYTLRHLPMDKVHVYLQHQTSVMQAFMGIGFEEEDYCNVLVSYVWDISYEWLVHSIAPATKVLFIDHSSLDEMVAYFAEDAFASEAYDDQQHYIPERIRVVKRLAKTDDSVEVLPCEEGRLVCLPDQTSLSGFLTDNQGLRSAQIIQLYGNRDSDVLVEDLCKMYNRGKCGAHDLKRIIIGEDRKLYTCFHGQCIGHIEELPQRQLIKERIETVYNEMMQKRECKSCSIYESCPKCMWPGKISDEEYCTMQRDLKRNRQMSTIYKAVKMKYCYVF